jgi:hypothetical protein
MTTADKCSEQGCHRRATRAITWSACRCHGRRETLRYCASCYVDDGLVVRCTRCWESLSAVRRYRSLYDYHRDQWMRTGTIASREAMTAQVTLTEPPDWDTWGSIMKPVPAKTRTERMAAPAVRTVILPVILAAVLIGILAGAGLIFR